MGWAETAHSCGAGDFPRYRNNTNSQRRLVNLVNISHGSQVENKYHFFVYWVAPIKIAIGIDLEMDWCMTVAVKGSGSI